MLSTMVNIFKRRTIDFILIGIDCEIKINSRRYWGSLARAGKVRNQTPKQERIDKGKQLTGRAKRRAMCM